MSNFEFITRYDFSGIPVYRSNVLPTYKYVEPEKNWVDRVLEWNPCNPKKPMVKVETHEVLVSKDAIFANPSAFSVFTNLTA